MNMSPISKGILVNPGENIQYAIDACEKEGGGVVTCVAGTHVVGYNITIPSFITLQGEGRDTTRLDFEDQNFQIIVTGTGGSSQTVKARNVRIKDITIERSSNTVAAVIFTYANHFILDNVRFSDNAGSGLKVVSCQQYTVFNCLADNNITNGFELTSLTTTSIYPHARFTYLGCIATNNGTNGFQLTSTASLVVANGALVSCESDNNGTDGYDFNAGGIEIATYVTNCIANGNGATNLGHGFHMDAAYLSIVACTAQDNDRRGFYNLGIHNSISSSTATGNGDSDYASDARLSFVGNIMTFGASQNPALLVDNKWGTSAVSATGNVGADDIIEKQVRQVKNTSGGTIAQGAVVVMKAVAGGLEITTTTTQGDDLVYGMAMFSIADTEYGAVLLEGFTALLKVDGTTDIAINDLLGTFTSAGIAMKAAAGDMAFAIALEAYATNDSNGVIDAILIKPRKL